MRVFLGALVAVCAWAGGLETELAGLTRDFDGRVGVCVQGAMEPACVRGDERFAMQSVMKLLVGSAVLDAVDNRGWKLDETAEIQRKDLSLYVQPLAKLVGPNGWRTTVGDLVRRAIIDSDSAATDILIAKLGGTSAVQEMLRRKGIEGIRLDRDERHLQTEIVGLTWRPEFVDPKVLDRAIEAVPERVRARAYSEYQNDPRDTATPGGMAAFSFDWRRGGCCRIHRRLSFCGL